LNFLWESCQNRDFKRDSYIGKSTWDLTGADAPLYKEAAKTLNFLTENNLLQYSDLATKERETAAKALKAAFPSGKLPNLAALQTEYATLTEKKNALRAEYSALKKSAQEYGVVRRNVDSILNPGEPKAKCWERGAEL
jgi:hypothetical protein